jgi:hypothetical protein
MSQKTLLCAGFFMVDHKILFCYTKKMDKLLWQKNNTKKTGKNSPVDHKFPLSYNIGIA